MQGDYVIARSFGDVPIVRRVWKIDENAVYICTEERFNKLKAGNANLLLVGFPRKDVFVYDKKLLSELEVHFKTKPSLWNKLTVWSESNK